MVKTFQALNEMKKDGIVEAYAVGGAMASFFYMEPALTYDLDVFVIIKTAVNELNPLKHVFEWARKKGYVFAGEHIVIGGIPVQILPAYNALIEEAVLSAKQKKYNHESVFVIDPEHLFAIMLDTFRPKDRERMLRFLKEVKMDQGQLASILKKHGLDLKYHSFRRRNGKQV